MLATLGFLTIVVLLAAILSQKMTPLTALVAVPVVAALIGGFGTKTAVFMCTASRVLRPLPGCLCSRFCTSAS
jgi:citrate-Mg2+:H+ or citrate-Ca2+:H+ symporter, CitMHS family